MIFKKIRKGHVDWRNFLCGTPANDYIFQKDTYEYRIDRAVEYIRNADCILIGAGAGASTAAGISMGGKRFTDNFAEFIEKYGSRYMTDMYAAGFYPFPTEEAKWGYWSKAALLNRFDLPALPLYKELYDIVKRKEYFVLTTNVDHQFYKAGFDENRIFDLDYLINESKLKLKRQIFSDKIHTENYIKDRTDEITLYTNLTFNDKLMILMIFLMVLICY